MTSGRVRRWLFVLAPLLLASPTVRTMVESHMVSHMLGELPVLFAAGWSTASLMLRRPRSRAWLRLQRRLDWNGWTAAIIGSIVASVWMLPLALDAALLRSDVAVAKFASCWLAGWLLADGWRRMDAEVRLFFGGNLAWMMATAGLLYVDSPGRLCVNYLSEDQQYAGIGLVALALVLGTLTVRQILWPNRCSSTEVGAIATAP